MTAANVTWSESVDILEARDQEAIAISSPQFRLNHAWNECFEQLDRISLLEDDWDGLGADAPAREVVDDAYSYLNGLRAETMPPPSRTIATPDGSILLEWLTDSKDRLEIEFSEPGLLECYWRECGSTPQFREHKLAPRYEDDIAWAAPSLDATSAVG